jgi:hypothetical protein
MLFLSMIYLLVVKLILEGMESDTNCWITEKGGGGGGELVIEKLSFLTTKCKCYINVALSSIVAE